MPSNRVREYSVSSDFAFNTPPQRTWWQVMGKMLANIKRMPPQPWTIYFLPSDTHNSYHDSDIRTHFQSVSSKNVQGTRMVGCVCHPALGRQRRRDYNVETSLGYIVRPRQSHRERGGGGGEGSVAQSVAQIFIDYSLYRRQLLTSVS